MELPRGLASGGGGYLRPDIRVSTEAGGWSIAHSFWELGIVASELRDRARFQAFLDRRIPAASLIGEDEGVSALVVLLAAQGCLTYDSLLTVLEPAEVNYIVQAAVSGWYGSYYGHPFWRELAECRVTKTQVFGWLLRTYHLSRSVGATAARGAVHSPFAAARDTFFRNAVDEYSHCQDYYLPLHSAFDLNESELKSLTPTPSSTAFDQQMAAIAENDWLAHAIVAYFQEHTTSYRANAFALYDRLAEHYGLGDFFESWKAHIGFDIEQNHAAEFERLIAQGPMSREQLEISLGAAAVTVEYLIGALDELLAIDPAATPRTLRPPLRSWRQTAVPHRQGAKLSDYSERLVELASPDLMTEASTLAEILAEILSPPVLETVLLEALSRCEDHDSVLCFGAALESLGLRGSRAARPLPAPANAVLNFLCQHSVVSRQAGWLLLLLFDLEQMCRSDKADRTSRAAEHIRRWADDIVLGREEAEMLDALASRFLELCKAATRLWRQPLSVGLFARPLPHPA